jgi:hypothetical protein
LTVANSTFSGNTSDNGTGGINQFNGTLTLTNSTFSGNSGPLGGGIRASTPATLKNTILANSPSGGNCAIDSFFGGQIIDDGFNISSDASCAFSQPTSRNSTNPLLDPNGLQDNGGPTKTIALLPTSPAIDQGKDASGAGTDQRSKPRPIDFPSIQNAPGGDGSDIGAFELQQLPSGGGGGGGGGGTPPGGGGGGGTPPDGGGGGGTPPGGGGSGHHHKGHRHHGHHHGGHHHKHH